RNGSGRAHDNPAQHGGAGAKGSTRRRTETPEQRLADKEEHDDFGGNRFRPKHAACARIDALSLPANDREIVVQRVAAENERGDDEDAAKRRYAEQAQARTEIDVLGMGSR